MDGKASLLLLIFPKLCLWTMLHKSDKVMLLRLLGLLIFSSLCSAMLVPDNTELGSGEVPPFELPDTGTFRSGLLPFPPTGELNGTTNPMIPIVPDPTICDLLMNAPVPPSIAEIPFFCACWRCKGTAGPKGDRGDRGPPGIPGSPGMRGMTGFTGRPGFTGPPGIKGQKGDMGDKGQPGPSGFTGTKGERGFKGDKGDQGLLGPPGPQGPQGETGVCPASCQTIEGPQGLQGPPGPAGARGLPGVEGLIGAKGLKGDKGDMGRPGDPGLNGQKGDQGAQGQCTCTDGAKGADGKPGEKGAKGDKGDTGTQGVQGPTGLKGSQGMLGPIGLPGPCSPTIQSAFSASIQQSFPPENQPIIFQNVFTNIPGHYNPNTGIYTAPVNGTYVFSFHLAVALRPLKVGLFRNLFPIVRATEANNQATSSQTIVLHLSTFDQVWLQVKNSVTNGIFTDSESTSTFSGYLLYPDSCDLMAGRDFGFPQQYNPEDFNWEGPPTSPDSDKHTTKAPPQHTTALNGTYNWEGPHNTTAMEEHKEPTTAPPPRTTAMEEPKEPTTAPPLHASTLAEQMDTTTTTPPHTAVMEEEPTTEPPPHTSMVEGPQDTTAPPP